MVGNPHHKQHRAGKPRGQSVRPVTARSTRARPAYSRNATRTAMTGNFQRALSPLRQFGSAEEPEPAYDSLPQAQQHLPSGRAVLPFQQQTRQANQQPHRQQPEQHPVGGAVDKIQPQGCRLGSSRQGEGGLLLGRSSGLQVLGRIRTGKDQPVGFARLQRGAHRDGHLTVWEPVRLAWPCQTTVPSSFRRVTVHRSSPAFSPIRGRTVTEESQEY